MWLLLLSLLLFNLPQAGDPKPALQPKKIDAKQVSIVTSQSTNDAGPGATVSLFVDVFPQPRMHVYAPDQGAGYIRVTLELDDTKTLNAGKPRFPKSTGYFFAPLNQTFRVYDRPFRISQSVRLRKAAANRRAAANGVITITGTLRYQACDDEVCYRPDEVKLRWHVGLMAR